MGILHSVYELKTFFQRKNKNTRKRFITYTTRIHLGTRYFNNGKKKKNIFSFLNSRTVNCVRPPTAASLSDLHASSTRERSERVYTEKPDVSDTRTIYTISCYYHYYYYYTYDEKKTCAYCQKRLKRSAQNGYRT